MIEATLPHRYVLAGYVVESVLGRGAFGVVYRARAPSGVTVALKVLDGRGDTKTILIEPEILAALHHPNIVGLVDRFFAAGSLVLVMEHVHGPTLDAYERERGQLPAAEVRELLVQLAQGLDHAHRRSVLHRDIKPANILVDLRGPTPRFVLADFGVARIVEGIQLHRRVGGTYYFMAPEQLRGRASMQSDLWALGVVAYRALTGRLPFSGRNIDEMTRSVLYDTPLAPSRLVAGIPPELDDIVLRLLEKQLENRTATAAELLARLGYAPAGTDGAPRGNGRRTTWEATTEVTIRSNWGLVVVTAGLAGLPSGPVSGTLQIVAAAALRKAYRERRPAGWYFLLPLALAVLAVLAGFVERSMLVEIFDQLFGSGSEKARKAVAFLWWMMVIPFPVHFLFEAVRLQRDLALVRGVRAKAGEPLALLEALEQMLDNHPDDVTIHVRYVEALLAVGRRREAVIEAKVVLEDDPYNFGAALLLAHAYFELGLSALCVEVCDAHLQTTPYSFELSDLRRRALHTAR